MTAVVDVKARTDAAWQRDVPEGCACPYTWRDGHWQRNPAETCGKHPVSELLAAEVS